ncbi:MAG: DMT family transporter [Deltaproteobacteria bacterium]|nr:MAG: DMT family transporter [Deltaproteobacteria bacterium]
MTRPTIRRGPLLMAGATLAFTVMVGLVKVARAELTAMEIVLWRGVVGIPLAALLLRGRPLRIHGRRLMLARVVLGFLAMICFYTAAKGLSVADHALITKVQPLLVAGVAPMVLGADERPDGRVVGALVLGMAGCALLLAPDLQGGGTWGLWALAAAALSAMAHTALRGLGRTDHPAVIVFWLQVAILPLSLALQLAWDGHPPRIPPASLWGPIAGVGACAIVGQSLMTRAYRHDKAALVAGASYLAPLFGVVGDAAFFSTLPSVWTLAGGSLIVASGIAVVLARQEPA